MLRARLNGFAGASWRARRTFLAVAAVLGALLISQTVAPASAHAADLFPVDDWIGDGLKKTGEVAVGPLKLGAEQIAKLLAAVVGALADLLIPKSLVRAGVDGIAWLVQLPPVGSSLTPSSDGGYALTVRMPHVTELRSTLTWVGITLLPLGLVLAGGRAVLAPSLYGESPTEILLRVVAAGFGLTVYDFAWGVLTQLSHLLTSSLLKLPWVADGVERMFEALLIGGAGGAVVAAEFVIPLLIAVAGAALLALLLLRVALEVGAALLYVVGGLLLGLSPTEFGRRLLTAWLIAATAMLLLPLLWTIVFVCGAAIMLDAPAAAAKHDLGAFVAQLYNVAAAIATFGIAIKLAQSVMRRAHSGIGALGGINHVGRTSRGPSTPGTGTHPPRVKVQQSLAAFSHGIRGRGAAAARGGAGPGRHPRPAAPAAPDPARRPVQATREAAGALRDALTSVRTDGAAVADTARTRAQGWYDHERHSGRFSARNADQRREQAAAVRETSAVGTHQGRGAAPPSNGSPAREQRLPSRGAPVVPASGPQPPPARETDAAPPDELPATATRRATARSSARPPGDPSELPASLSLSPRRRRRRDRKPDDRQDQS